MIKRIESSSIERERLYHKDYKGTSKFIRKDVANDESDNYYNPLAKFLTVILETTKEDAYAGEEKGGSL